MTQTIRSFQIKSNSVILCLTFVLLISQVMITVLSFHIPSGSSRYNGMMRRQDDIDSDGDEEMDSGASAPYQNQDDGGQGAGADGYEDNEADGPYDETPREQEGQADLERFFDDHLGASEKDGMDKENLPTNLIPSITTPPLNIINNNNNKSANVRTPPPSPASSEMSTAAYSNIIRENQKVSTPTSFINMQPNLSTSESSKSNYIETRGERGNVVPNYETRFIHLPNNKIIITRQSVTRGPIYKGGLDLPEIPPIPEHYIKHAELLQDLQAEQNNNNDNDKDHSAKHSDGDDNDNLNARGSNHIIATENEDLDRVYVTRLTNKPFRIPALGGYDPEEDFRNASEDILEEPARIKQQASRNHRSRVRNKARKDYNNDREGSSGADGDEENIQKDISFNDPEPDTLFNDASETDEVTFDDPYQTDLEAEMLAQAYDKPGKPTEFGSSKSRREPSKRSASEEEESGDESSPSIMSKGLVSSRRRDKDDEDDHDGEGGWVNDGVEDMDIPSQSHQDVILAKAAKQDALARRLAEEEAAADAQQAAADQPEQEDPENQRMSNADYLKDDLRSIDQEDDN